MKKLAIPAALVAITAIVFLLLKYSVAPSPIKIMSPSTFERPDQSGAVVYKRFYDPLSRASFAVFGAPPRPEFHARIAEGFLAAAASVGKPYQAVLAEPALEPLREVHGASIEAFNINEPDLTAAAAKLKDLASQGKRVFIYTASTFSSHVLKENAIHRLEQALGQPLFALTSGTLVVRATHERLIDPPCVGIARDSHGTAGLGCLMLTTSRRFYRKKLPLDKWVSLMEQEAGGDFLLLTSSPEMAQRAERTGPQAPVPMPVRPDSGPAGRTASPVE